LSANDYVQLYLRDWIDAKAMHDGVALHGMSAADADLLYLRNGRPPTARQMIVGYRRGGRVDGITDSERAYVAKSVRQSDIRPEYVELEHYANLTYPSGFMIRGATQAGDITPEQASALLLESGWPSKWVDVFVGSWSKGGGTKADPHVTKAQTQLWNRT